MKLAKTILLTAIAAQVLTTSCKKTNDLSTETSESIANSTVSVTYELKTINQTATISQRVAGGNLQWTSGYASPTLLKFEATKGANELEFKSKSTQHIDLFSALTSSLGSIPIPNGTFDKVEFKIQLNKNGNNAALELNGVFGAPNGNIPVTFRADEALEIKTEQSSVTITANGINSTITSLDLSKLTAGITQSTLANAKLTNGAIIISSSSNANIYQAIINNLNKLHHLELNHH